MPLRPLQVRAWQWLVRAGVGVRGCGAGVLCDRAAAGLHAVELCCPFSDVRWPVVNGEAVKKKACASCSCGRAEDDVEEEPVKLTMDMLENPTSGCGSVSVCGVFLAGLGGQRVLCVARWVAGLGVPWLVPCAVEPAPRAVHVRVGVSAHGFPPTSCAVLVGRRIPVWDVPVHGSPQV